MYHIAIYHADWTIYEDFVLIIILFCLKDAQTLSWRSWLVALTPTTIFQVYLFLHDVARILFIESMLLMLQELSNELISLGGGGEGRKRS